MHSDERRGPEALEILRYKAVISDPEGAFAKIQAMSQYDQSAQLSKLIAERNDLKRRVSELWHELQASRTSTDRAIKKAESSEAKIAALRNSKTMKAGKLITSPVRFVRSPKAELAKYGRVFNKILAASKSGDNSDVATAKQLDGAVVKKQSWPANFENELNRLWYQEGSISGAWRHLQAKPAELQLSDSAQLLALRVGGAWRLSQCEDLLPVRNKSAAYRVEIDRVMYCVHSSPVFNSNGYSTRTRGVAAGLRAAGVDIVTVARSGYPWDSKVDRKKPSTRRYEKTLDGVTYVHVPGGNLNRNALDHYFLEAADAFVREARILRPAVIQAASNYRTALPALIAARRLGIPFVYEVRGLWELTEASAKPGFERTERFAQMKRLETLVATEADQVLAITEQVADVLISRGVDPSKITVAPNAVETERFLPFLKDEAYAAKKAIDSSVPVIGFAGSLVDYEGLDLLIEASGLLSRRGVVHQVVIAGSGAAEKSLAAKISAHPDRNVKMLGRLPQNEIPRLLSVFDIVACPRKSAIITELVSPLKPLEAFASGKATVLSDVAPNVDLAGGRESPRAVLFESGSAEALADSLQLLIDDAERQRTLGRQGRLWCIAERNWANIGQTMARVQLDARNGYAGNTHTTERKVSELTVGIIGDEFTRTTLQGSFQAIFLDRNLWQEQLNEITFDMIFVESAWEGNEAQWHRGVGYYSDEESADLRKLLAVANEKSIPTVFWNKEDPVHFKRFAPNAALFDHVFTTDANMIPEYLAIPGNRNITVSAMPFYAQPEIHNPLPVEREFHSTFAYAGTYYGQRYADRSKGLDALLRVAKKFGLEIYDRQAANPDSPYKFPAKYRQDVRGALPYAEVIESYSTHLAHLNVSSVTNSPTMFSRRVVEIPACGGVVVSAKGRGITESLGSNIASSNDEEDLNAWMLEWKTNSQGRLQEIWRQMRTIYRAHTTDTAMAILCRTAGIAVEGVTSPSYAISTEKLTVEQAEELVRQSVRPVAVRADDFQRGSKGVLQKAGIQALNLDEPVQADFEGPLPESLPRTFFEDLLLPAQFGTWAFMSAQQSDTYDGQSSVVRPAVNPSGYTLSAINPVPSKGVVVTMPPVDECGMKTCQGAVTTEYLAPGSTILVAGHDLKFAQGILSRLEQCGYKILVDQWESHSKHDEERSRQLLAQADAVFCEWGLGNAVWYSQNVEPNQRLVVRVHSQELFRPFLKQIATESVDAFVFVGEFIKRSAILSHGIPSDKSIVIPNPVNVQALDLPKTEDAEFAIGFVGIVPQQKRLDLALDVVEKLVTQDARWHLRVKGKTPQDYPWMLNRPEEMAFYEKQFARIKQLNEQYPGAVVLDGYGADMEEWYRKVSTVISTSNFESFHLTLADGAASGAMPVSLAWPGSDLIYPSDWIVANIDEMVEKIAERSIDSSKAQLLVRERFQQDAVLKELVGVIATDDRDL